MSKCKIVKCAGCGKPFPIKSYELQRSSSPDKVCCSSSCRTGELNNAWKGGPEASRLRLIEKRRRQRQDPRYRLDKSIFAAVRRAMLRGLETSKVLSVFPYSSREMRNHLISTIPKGFSVADYHKRIIEIDHIRPLSAFCYESAEEPAFLEAWALSNLRLVSITENRAKGTRLHYVPTTRYKTRFSKKAVFPPKNANVSA